MTVPETAPARKPRRFGLYAPFVLLAIAAAAWAGFWWFASSEAARRMDQVAVALRAQGYEVSWKDRRIDGFPYRMRITLSEPSLREPSGWGLAAPELTAETRLIALTQWVVETPQGLTFNRPIGGPVAVSGEQIRASLGGIDKTPPRISFEGKKLTFRPQAGAEPFFLSAADKVELHLRPGPDDQAAVLLKVDGATARLSGLVARIAGDKPVSVVWDSLLTRISALTGGDWPSAVRAWSGAGGQIQLRQGGITAGDALVGVQSGLLSVGADGRLRGALEANLRQAPRALAVMGETGAIAPEAANAAAAVAAARQGQGELARATIVFEAGQTTLGPVRLGPAPRVY